MDKRLPFSEKNLQYVLATAEVRSAQTPGAKALVVVQLIVITPTQLEKYNICPRTTYYRALRRQKQGFNIGQEGGTQKLSNEDELLLERQILSEQHSGRLVRPQDVIAMVSSTFTFNISHPSLG